LPPRTDDFARNIMTPEHDRLREYRDRTADWKQWGPYLSERAWGTVREDYSADGSAWTYFPHDHARSRAYRWSEDGLLGICDRQQNLCFAIALWNGNDPILKERLFGLTGPQGNHGEDVKEYYWFLDSTPTHSYMKALYKYPQAAYPYEKLITENAKRTRLEPEYELIDTGVFGDDRYFDVVAEYAKAAPGDMLIRITVVNRGPEAATLHLLPTIWFRNTWSWGDPVERPKLSVAAGATPAVRADHPDLGTRWLICDASENSEFLFTENETNVAKVFPGGQSRSSYVKDGINESVVGGHSGACNPNQTGTKAAAHYDLTMGPGETRTIKLRLSNDLSQAQEASFDAIFDTRRNEADAFYATIAPQGASDDARAVQRQALAGMLWSKQYYRYDLTRWLMGDATQPAPPASRWEGRNHDWTHFDADSILSMPDSWEYPWFAAWDLAFHCIPLALVDADFAKRQLILLLREWFMHPNGQVPAYEWAFGDVNPPVHAWSALRVYQIDRRITGVADTKFLARVFHKLLINFTWWVNRKDPQGRNVFQGGFLGLDNIGLFDRSAPIPGGAHIDQSDGTSWMAMYCLNMLAIALELSDHDTSYEDVATKFLEHFFHIAHAMNDRPTTQADDGIDLWDSEDGFYYDVLHYPDGTHSYLKVRSMVGLIPLLAVMTIEPELLDKLPGFKRRFEWFILHRPDLVKNVAPVNETGQGGRHLFSIVNAERLKRILWRMLDEAEFLSPHGIRSLSRYHLDHPVIREIDGRTYRCDYEPAESNTQLFGGNSNWRGPVWFPINYLLIESLQKFDHYFGPDFKVECPTGSGKWLSLWDLSTELSTRLIKIFVPDQAGLRPVLGTSDKFQHDPQFNGYIPFHEYFHGDTGAGLGASHQTGWTGLVAKLIQQSGACERS
jgi:hypothetical protein